MSLHVSTHRLMAPDITARKGGVPIVSLTSYHAHTAALADKYCDFLLVGDSLGMVMHGFETTVPVPLDLMIMHGRAVVRGSKRALVVIDMPFGTYEESPAMAFRNAARVMKETDCGAVKLEGGVRMVPQLEALQRADIPVMGHIGLTPQSVHRMGGFKVQRDAEELLADARAVEAAGAFGMVVEGVPTELGEAITKAVGIPTIGIGAGPHCDGQVLVWHDVLGLFDGFRPKFVKRYAELGELTREAISSYCDEVRSGAFPGAEHGFK